ncbi:hypothetical protein GCM10027293_22040 [Pontibacter aydingkolensis]
MSGTRGGISFSIVKTTFNKKQNEKNTIVEFLAAHCYGKPGSGAGKNNNR